MWTTLVQFDTGNFMNMYNSSALEGQPRLTREECACIFEREFQSAAEYIQEHPEGPNFVECLMSRLPQECITMLIEGALLEPVIDD